MSELVKIIECPRDAWQNLPKIISPEVKADYLRQLVQAGFQYIDAASFVSRRAMPQMADSEYVLEYLDAPEEIEMIGVAVNARGAERASESGRVKTLAFPYSISPTYLERNQNQSPEDAVEQLEQVGEIAYKAGMDTVGYLSMAFGNPYGDAWDIDEVVSAVDILVDSGVLAVSLADTAGMASADTIRNVLSCVIGVHDGLEIGVHLHSKVEDAPLKIKAAYDAGCRRFDASMAGLGSSPFTQDPLVGNVSTELLIATLKHIGAELPDLEPLDRLIASSKDIAKRYSQVQ